MIQVHGKELALVINELAWAVGLAVECALVWVVFSRRIAGRFPAFAALMIFYPLRAALLLICQGHIGAGIYKSLFSALIMTEFALQMFLAGEIAFRWAGEAGGQMRQYGLLMAIAAGAAALAWSVFAVVSERVEVNGWEIFVWFLMSGLFAVVVSGAHGANLVRIAAGFAAFSVLQLVTLAGRFHAWAGRDLREYLVWSYVPAAGYVAVMIFWLWALQREGGVPAVEKAAAR
jgi:hypothetical protein